jgi:molybdopterin converting factor small subunit
MAKQSTFEIRVKLLFDFTKHAPDGQREFSWELSPGSTVGQVITTLGISKESMFVVSVNGRMATLTQSLSQGDSMVVFPPVGGG